jgi:antitoxin component of MazEF toxin-antitoxin module
MAQQLVTKSCYVRAQNIAGSTLGMSIPKIYADNLGIKPHDNLRVSQDGDILIVRKALEEE